MPEESTLRYNDVVPGGTLTLTVWHYGGWAELVKAAAGGDERRLQSLVWESDTGKAGGQRAFSALFITAHRGHLMALRLLLHGGANVKMQTRLGRGPLHVAAAQGRTQCVEELLQGGAPAQQTDTDGLTPLCLATMLGQKGSVRQLCQFQWQQRAAGVRLRSHLEPGELLAHQRFDSRLKTWSRGPQAQMYMASLLRRGESQGTALGGPTNRDVHSGDTDTAEHGRSAVHSCN
ncbi:ANR60 protein, partial [Amia calva]|nr:ANR60 protein [Amia calva]